MFVSVHMLYKSMRSLIFIVKVDPQKWMSSAEDFGSPEDFESDEIGVTLKTRIFMRGLWSVKTFVFVVSFSLSWVIGNTVLLKGVEVKLSKHFPSDAHLKILHLPNPFEWSHWKSHTVQSISSVTETKIF